ncbi:MAG: DUF2326 domain-containing protein [Spirochaetales bacterium]|nr:DUF2326 domain-containing protein [Spirochaetales bacterium]
MKSDLSQLEERQINFQVAENINYLKDQLNNKRNEMNKVTKEILIYKNNINKLEKSISHNAEISAENIIELYNKTAIVLSDKITKTLNDVEEFQKKLITNRNKRLSEDLKTYRSMLKDSENYRNEIEEYINSLYLIINTHGSFQELTILNKKIVEVNQKISSLNRYQELSKEIENEILELNSQLAKSNSDAQKYLNEQSENLESINNYFSRIIENLYGPQGAGTIDVKNNKSKKALTRFQFETKVYRDGSDGINNMKIFAFGLLLLHLGNSPYEFLVFDNKIFYGDDFEQAAELMRFISKEEISSQIIFSINQSDYNSIIQKLSLTGDENLIDDYIELELTGDESGTLLGEYIDLQIGNI